MLKKTLFSLTGLIVATILLASCGHNVDVVESGTYDGRVVEVKPDEQEIYVETEDNKTIELYFTDSTRLMQNGESVNFSALEKDARVAVTVEKMGKKLNPLAVKIK